MLSALDGQTLDKELWELIVVDNGSADALACRQDLCWPANCRIIREETAGLTAARLRGIAESVGSILVFVDDDNILNAKYLEFALEIGGEWKMLGVWGGRIDPRFEVPPPEWTRHHWEKLAIKPVTRPMWSNVLYSGAIVCGAGMCVRRVLAQRYAEILSSDAYRRALDRMGVSLASGGDTDLAMMVLDEGYGNGLFPHLKLDHLIPSGRLQESYLLQLTEEMTLSCLKLLFLRKQEVRLRGWISEAFEWMRSRKMPRRERAFWNAERKARLRFQKWRKAMMVNGVSSQEN